MNSQTYIEETRRTRPNKKDRHDLHFMQSVMGIASEAGEIVGLTEKSLCQGHDLDANKLKKELGDLMWYVAMLMDEFGFTFEEVFDANIAKLKTRYPEKFSTEDSIRRKDADYG
jgi:NTP pyrophosphatase (non-canonical NTP hydrolase)